MKRLLIMGCALCLLLGCSGEKKAVSLDVQPTAKAIESAQPLKQEQMEIKVELRTPIPTLVPTPEPTTEPTPEPTPTPTPEPTPTAVPKLGVLDYGFADKFVEGDPVITDLSYQSDRAAIFITRVEDTTGTVSRKPYVYYLADVYFQDMEDFRAGFYHSMDFQ